MITYDVFQPMSISSYPDMPFTATILNPNGDFQKVTISNNSDLVRYGEAVAIKFDKPEPFVVRAAQIAKGIGCDSAYARQIIRQALAFMEGEKVDRQPSDEDWLERKLNSLGIFGSRREDITKWFYYPEAYPTAPMKSNSILTVKKVTGGRVIVSPAGHTISYTKAQQLWYAMNDSSYAFTQYPTVGEYSGGKIRHRSYHRLHIHANKLTIGCQVIPREAIKDLAAREGWGKKTPYYYKG